MFYKNGIIFTSFLFFALSQYCGAMTETPSFILMDTNEKEYLLSSTQEEYDFLNSYQEQEIQKAKKTIEQKEYQEFEITTETGLTIPITFFDRSSDKVLFVGQGINMPKEKFFFYARIFHDYDVVVFDYRWRDMLQFVIHPDMLICPIQRLFIDEKEEVINVVNFIKSRKKYDMAIGLGVCYSTTTFTLAQNESDKPLFDKLILDSCPLSLKSLVHQVTLDPSLLLSSQISFLPDWLKTMVQTPFMQFVPSLLRELLTPDISIIEHLSDVNEQTPLLFIHGQDDLLFPLDTAFSEIFQAPQVLKKHAFITPFGHAVNIKNGNIYKFVCDQFIHQDDLSALFKKKLRLTA